MKKINVTVVCVGEETYPGCIDLLAACPAINIVARRTGLDEVATWRALARSDVLLLDEAALELDGHEAVQEIHDRFTSLRSLLVLDNQTDQEMVSVLSLGIKGVIKRKSTLSFLCKAISAICAGEAWLSRDMVKPLRNHLDRDEGSSRLLDELANMPGSVKLH